MLVLRFEFNIYTAVCNFFGASLSIFTIISIEKYLARPEDVLAEVYNFAAKNETL